MKGNIPFKDHIYWRKRGHSGSENRGENYLESLLTINTKNKASDKILPYFSLLRRKKKLFNLANISEFFLHAR